MMSVKQKVRSKIAVYKARKAEEKREYQQAYIKAKTEAEVKAREGRLESVRQKATTRATARAQPITRQAAQAWGTYQKSYAKRHKGGNLGLGLGGGGTNFETLAFGTKPKKRRKKRRTSGRTITIKL